MIEHVSLAVKNFSEAKRFYIAALKPLSYKLNMEFPGAAGFMAEGHTSFWIVKKPRGYKMHVAFRAKSKKVVRDFHAVALKAGGEDHGRPGLRKDYSPDYYAAFILDPDGNNIEAVCFK